MDMLQPILAVALVVGLLCGSLYFLRIRGAAAFRLPRISSGGFRNGGDRKLEVLERVSLGPHHALHVVRVGGRSIVVATTPSSCQVVCDLLPGQELKEL
jgi:flagellar biogenesis protein FliO